MKADGEITSDYEISEEKDNRKKKKRGEDGGREREREWSD